MDEEPWRTAGEWLRERGIAFDHVYSSTSERACDTCELVVPGVPYVREKGLKEWNFGTFEGFRGHQSSVALWRLLRSVWGRGRDGV